ncbi:DUF1302 family protein [Cupriavidus basilensis]
MTEPTAARNSNDAPDTVNHSGTFGEFTDSARWRLGQRAQLLDAYAYGTFDIDNTRLNVKPAGNQVIAWGESLFFPNIAESSGSGGCHTRPMCQEPK